ncbi:homing endonuclease associated repeat-containing protein [Halovenus halobia]|uniref:homing endonuclease associated repeat-containing protein n=1 Tax=Halovenus halobia TaxID=3396622 RepID=UPI003F558FB3
MDDPTETKVSDDELLTELRRVEQSVDESPTRREMDRVGEYPSSTYKYRFGSWNGALEAANLPPNECTTESGTDPYGPEWETCRRRILQRDEYQCRVCKRDATELAKSLHVHHIKPLRTFVEHDGSVDFEQAHEPTNLVTLCPSCHLTYEGTYRESSPSEFVRQVRDAETEK